MDIFPWKNSPTFKSKLIGYIESKEKSTAEKMAKFIEEESDKYPLKHLYSLTSPNSNTFAQGILNKFPESKLKSPSNAFGKNHEIHK